jgi:hypothetical protein
VAQVYSELAPRLRSRASPVRGTASSRREPLHCLWLQCPRQVRLRVEFKRWVTAGDADEDLLRSALLAFEN